MKTMLRMIVLLLLSLWSYSSFGVKVGGTAEEKPVAATIVKVGEAGSLATMLTEVQQDTCRHLIVSGKLNSADIKVLRKMAGADGRGRLRLLNLMGAEIVSSEAPYLVIPCAEDMIVPNLSSEYILPTQIYWGGPTKDISMYASDDLPPVEETKYPGGRASELRHANFVLLGNADKTLNAQTKSQSISQWDKITRQRLKAKGHIVSKDKDGHFTYSAFTRKGLFCEDMFYHCPNLQLVILPCKGKVYDRVVIAGDPIRYKEVASSVD